MIPDAAVSAALVARAEFKNQRGMDNAANLMRHILEAAAPYMLAEAWQRGNRAAVGRANPHRPTP